MGDDNELIPIPKFFRTYYDVKADLDTLTGLREGEIAFATDEGILYRQDGNGAANWLSISVASDMREIGDVTLTAPAATIEFAAIPAGYAVFMLIWQNVNGDNAGNTQMHLTYNADGGANYDWSVQTFNIATGTTHASPFLHLGTFNGAIPQLINGHIQISNRAAIEKISYGIVTILAKGGATAEDVVGQHHEGKWRNVADEIATITLTPSAGNFIADSRIILLGVRT